ncbi:Uncharacterised protein [Vibrio cholerae]|nr:Uncharacterised protein [Vibrio cholerae]
MVTRLNVRPMPSYLIAVKPTKNPKRAVTPKPTMVKMHKSFAMRQIRKKRSVVRLAHHPIQPQAQSQHRAPVAL